MLNAVLRVLNYVGLRLNGGKPFSRKLVVSALTFALAWVVTYVVARGAFTVPPFVASYVPALVAVVAGAGAGWLTKEDPALFSDTAKK